MTRVGRLQARLRGGSNQFSNQCFLIVPSASAGPFFVRSTIRSEPLITDLLITDYSGATPMSFALPTAMQHSYAALDATTGTGSVAYRKSGGTSAGNNPGYRNRRQRRPLSRSVS